MSASTNPNYGSMTAATTTKTKERLLALGGVVDTARIRTAQLYIQVKFLGYSETMDDYEQRKLRIFNQLNFFLALSGLMIPLLGMLLPGSTPHTIWLMTCWPAVVNIVVLALNYFHKHNAALLTCFISYPLCICIVYLNGINPGIELHFLLLIVLSVFFLNDIGLMLFSIGLSMISFFILAVVLNHFLFEVAKENTLVFLLNKAISLAFIFYGLFLIKKENALYQFNILTKQKNLHEKNLEIEKQKEELADLNAFKTKLFSIISHDLKSPVYALRTLFQQIHQCNLPPSEIKAMVPDVLNDLTYTTSLMENLLQWAKSQMDADVVSPQEIRLEALVVDVIRPLRLQLETKKLSLEVEVDTDVHVYADKNTIHLVLRNLLSNAIKFTPTGGHILVGCTGKNGWKEVYVKDSGVGIDEEALQKICQQIFYTTKGTSSEAGTGLGLMLCNEFLAKNKSKLEITSTIGKGSRFSFLLPERAEENAG